LTCGLFALDLFMPLGVAIGALYAGIVLLASFSRIRDFRCSPPHAPPGCSLWGRGRALA
jgi:hypothetical protein